MVCRAIAARSRIRIEMINAGYFIAAVVIHLDAYITYTSAKALQGFAQ
jgi:hypothetical protein